MENKILLIEEVAALLRVSESTINRWVVEGRKGENTFPLPVSAKSGKRRWLRTDIESWIDSQSTITTVVPAQKRRQSAKAFQARQAETNRALAKYRAKGGTQ